MCQDIHVSSKLVLELIISKSGNLDNEKQVTVNKASEVALLGYVHVDPMLSKPLF